MSRYFLASLLLIGSMAHLKAEPLQDNYLRCYVEIHDADNMEKNKDYLGALVNFKIALKYLQALRDADAAWEPVMINKRLKDCQNAIIRLQPLASKQYLDSIKGPASSGPSLSDLERNALDLEKSHEYWKALEQFEKYSTLLEIIQVADPKWESVLIQEKLKESQTEIDQIVTSTVKEELLHKGSRPVQ